jgi:hypothetical protein
MRVQTVRARGRSTAALVVLVLLAAGASAEAAQPRFKQRAIHQLPQAAAFDLGVVALGRRPELSPFTINHFFPSALLRRGRDVTAEAALSPLPAFPGYERLGEAPEPGSPGLYVHGVRAPAQNGAQLVLRAHEQPAWGRLLFASRTVTIAEANDVTVERRRMSDMHEFTFLMASGGSLVLNVVSIDLPVFVSDVPEPAFVGADAVPSAGPDFQLELRDRHSYAAADFDGDGSRDLFIAGGGYGDRIDRYERWGRDELLLSRGGRLAAVPAPAKDGCRGRESAAPDANGDGRADIFVACEGARPLLHLQGQEPGEWSSERLAASGERYVWADLDADGSIDLLSFRGALMSVHEGGVRLKYTVELAAPPSGRPVFGDLLSRGRRPALFVPSTEGSTLVLGRRAVAPTRFGLPARSGAAAIVDVDNDGRRELHLAPQGLFRQRVAGRPGKPRFRRWSGPRIAAPLVGLSWEDSDRDGARDLLALSGRGAFAPYKRIHRFENRTRGGRWLAVDSAALPLGERIAVRAAGRRSVGWVGEAEGSLHSDTHRRVYFGLGKARRATVRIGTERGAAPPIRTRTNRLLRP